VGGLYWSVGDEYMGSSHHFCVVLVSACFTFYWVDTCSILRKEDFTLLVFDASRTHTYFFAFGLALSVSYLFIYLWCVRYAKAVALRYGDNFGSWWCVGVRTSHGSMTGCLDDPCTV
jgi:hypothetical protein